MTKIIATSDLRKNLSRVLSEVGYGGSLVLVQRNNEDLAAIVPAQYLKHLEEMIDRADLQAARQALARAGLAVASTAKKAAAKKTTAKKAAAKKTTAKKAAAKKTTAKKAAAKKTTAKTTVD